MPAFARVIRHFLMNPSRVRSAFPESALQNIEAAIASAEKSHGGEIRFAVEGELENAALWQNLSPRARAIQVFGELGVWDTERNNGVLLYVLLADQDVEIVADRGFAGKVSDAEWTLVCSKIEQAYRNRDFERGTLDGIAAISALISRQFPVTDRNELPNAPAIL
jgi:hypothetical protein